MVTTGPGGSGAVPPPLMGVYLQQGKNSNPPPLKNVTVLRRLSFANTQLLVRSLTLTPVPPRSPQMQRREIRYTGELTKVGGSLTHEPPGRGSWGGTSGRLPVWAPIISQALSIQIPQKRDTASPADILAKHAPTPLRLLLPGPFTQHSEKYPPHRVICFLFSCAWMGDAHSEKGASRQPSQVSQRGCTEVISTQMRMFPTSRSPFLYPNPAAAYRLSSPAPSTQHPDF